MDDMLVHAKAVSRGARQALVVGDMPFMSYQASVEDAIRNAGRFVQEGGMHAVKLEGGGPVVEITRRLTEIGIPVMGHLGLTPQSVHTMGGFKVQGKTDKQAARILADARALEEAGAFSIVLEGMPTKVAATVTHALRIPTIGIGAGPATDGQVLVFHDMLGLTTGKAPKFVKRYAALAEEISRAAAEYIEDVRTGRFPGPEHEYTTNGSTPAKDPTEVRYGG
jgi:3-methyl-2-oxobutanoate hydroxymethyltransferase